MSTQFLDPFPTSKQFLESSIIRIFICIMAIIALVFSYAIVTPAQAHAANDDSFKSIASQLAKNDREKTQMLLETGNLRYLLMPSPGVEIAESELSASDLQSRMLGASAGLPKYDMRDDNLVTSVKLQNPWGDCWGFAAIAAAETSIISKRGLDPSAVDLSELQVGWFAYSALPEGLEGSAATQAGEGMHAAGSLRSSPLDAGGVPFTATSIFSCGIGPVPESLIPYENAEKKIQYVGYMPFCYSADGNWSVPEDERFLQSIQLEDSRILPCPASSDASGNYKYNPAGTAAIKSEIAQGRAVAIGFHADQSQPGEASADAYINTATWAQYTYDDASPNHAVTIIGWDDTYSKSNFVSGHEPPEDGAWIVKNSWGASNEQFPNYNVWGIDGEGYFYLSYYDMSLLMPESFDFGTQEFQPRSFEPTVDQYDYLPASSVNTAYSYSPTSMANVFEASVDQRVSAISVETSAPGTNVQYEVYVLDEGFDNPENGKLMTSGSITYQFGGYHRIELGDDLFELQKGQRYSVVITQSHNGQYIVVANQCINQSGYDTYTSYGYALYSYGTGVVNAGESFMLSGNSWIDWKDELDLVEEQRGGIPMVDYDNFSIKAYATSLEDAAEKPNPPVQKHEFTDVYPDMWYDAYIDYICDKGLMKGYAGTTLFGPLDDMQRQDFALMLYRYHEPTAAKKAEEPEVVARTDNETGLVDVADHAYYTAAVNWAYSKGIITGYSGTEDFGVGDPITREQIATILWRMDKMPSTHDAYSLLKGFPDNGQVDYWAYSAMAYCVREKMITGDNGRLFPTQNALRAEIAKIMSVYIENAQ